MRKKSCSWNGLVIRYSFLCVLEKKGGCSEVDSCYFKNPFSHLVML